MDGTADADYNEWRIQKQEWIDMGSKENKVNDLRIRRAVPADLEGVTMVEAAAFPAGGSLRGFFPVASRTSWRQLFRGGITG